MKKPTLLYIPLLILFVLSAAAMTMHANRVFGDLSRGFSGTAARSPFKVNNQTVKNLYPEADAAGIETGDRVAAVGSQPVTSDQNFYDAVRKLKAGDRLDLTVEKTLGGQIERRDVNVVVSANDIGSFEFVGNALVGLIFLLALPLISFLLGFYVAFVRPRDLLAWLLLGVLLSIGSLGLDGWRNGTFVQTFVQSVQPFWGIWMLLFGVYFPERWSVDKKLPWLKWIIVAPLAVHAVVIVAGQIARFLGSDDLAATLFNLGAPVSFPLFILSLIAIGTFFAALGHKSGTLQNPDSRRRLRLLTIGTSAAILPMFAVILTGIVTGNSGSFFDRAPAWLALLALFTLLLFPLTLAYVIVVQRAMNVSVVVRQGLQYAFAKNGVRVLQFLLLLIVGVGVLWTIRNYGADISRQIAFIVGGIALVPLIDSIVKRLRVFIDRKFFREAYNAEQILSDLSEDVRTMVETKPLLETVSMKISESMHVPQIALLLKNGSDFQPAYALGYENAPNASLMESGKTIEKLRTNEPLVVYQDDENSWINEEANGAERENLRELNSQLLLPFGAKNQLSGVISLSPKRSEEPYSPNDLRLLKSVAAQTGLALENSRLTEAIVTEAAQRERLNTEIDIAREVQERLFPQELPEIEGLDYYGACRPALGVGGDYYDFIELPENKFGIAIGDISGKGIGASLMMASLQASLRGQAIHFKSDLAGLMKQINSLVYEASTSNRYATFFYAQYEPATGKLAYVNAGHNPPFLIRQNGEVVRLEEGGAVVGMLPPMLVNYKQGEIQLKPGDLLVGYTDGISEAMNPQEEEWSEDEMLVKLKTVADKSAAEILPFIVACADEFAAGAKQHDDMTMIVVKVRSE